MYLPLEYYITYLLPYCRFSFFFFLFPVSFFRGVSLLYLRNLPRYLPTYLMLLPCEEALEIC